MRKTAEKEDSRLDSTRIKVISKMLDFGYLTEKDIEKAKTEELLFLDGINIEDLRQIILLQKAIRKNSVIRYLAGMDLEESISSKSERNKEKSLAEEAKEEKEDEPNLII